MNAITINTEIDPEWKELIIEALTLGISVEDIRAFLNSPNRNHIHCT